MKTIFFLLMLCCSFSFSQSATELRAKRYFEKRCALCHGKQGDRQRFGSKNLRLSTLPDAEMMTVISNGRNRMPSWRSEFSQDQIREIIVYIKTFRS